MHWIDSWINVGIVEVLRDCACNCVTFAICHSMFGMSVTWGIMITVSCGISA